MQNTQRIFEEIGGEFLTPARSMADKFEKVKAFVFDWDGVFNNAQKDGVISSNFNEADSMGTNLLRFSHYLQYAKTPITAIISGENNSAAFYFSKREHFNSSYYKVAHKIDALEHLCKQHKLKHEEIAFVFDDVLDFSIAKVCRVRIMVNRKANPLLKKYVKQHNLADYITGCESGNSAVREACELMMGLGNNYDKTISERTDYSNQYKSYIEKRNTTETKFYTRKDNVIIESNPEK